MIKTLLQNCQHWDLVKLSGVHTGTPKAVLNLGDGYQLGIPFSRHCNAAALLLNRDTAEAMLANMLPMRLPYDQAMGLWAVVYSLIAKSVTSMSFLITL